MLERAGVSGKLKLEQAAWSKGRAAQAGAMV